MSELLCAVVPEYRYQKVHLAQVLWYSKNNATLMPYALSLLGMVVQGVSNCLVLCRCTC
jgi:hypothetical protein